MSILQPSELLQRVDTFPHDEVKAEGGVGVGEERIVAYEFEEIAEDAEFRDDVNQRVRFFHDAFFLFRWLIAGGLI